MATNLVIYCLEKITDYFEFERLCHDLMLREGYPSIEPLGGFSDKGRDAIHVDRSGKNAIFAYSVREDWRAKLAEDAAKIYKHGHQCQELVFVTTSDFSAAERDEAVASIKEQFGWNLNLFGLERLRPMLEVAHVDVRKIHPSIFPPELFESELRKKHDAERDHILVSSVPEEKILAGWLARKLLSEGYKVWCEAADLLVGDEYPRDIDQAIKSRTFRFIALYSRASLQNVEVVRQRALATSMTHELPNDFVIPLNVDGVDTAQLDNKTRLLPFISFDNWALGLASLLKKLESAKAPRLLPEGRYIVASTFLGPDVLSGTAETLFSNVLKVGKIPQVVHRFRAVERPLGKDLGELRSAWAFRQMGPASFLSFTSPPQEFADKHQIRKIGGAVWRDLRDIDRVPSNKLVVELVGKSFSIKLRQKGLRFCKDSELYYFPSDLVKNDYLPYARPDGEKSRIKVAGKRTYWRPGRSEEYMYFLAPEFIVRRGLFDEFNLLVRLQLRFTDTTGKVLSPRTALSRRKHLCRDWWNNDWANRVFAVCQFLADGAKIVIGDSDDDSLVVDASPMSLQAPEGINEQVLGKAPSENREELLDAMGGDAEDDTNESHA